MSHSTTAFSPRIHGFKFTNQFEVELPGSLPILGEVDLGGFMFGLCGGMCFTALDYFHAGEPPPSQSSIPKLGSRLHSHLVRKQIQSLLPPDGVIKVLTWTAREDGFVSRHTAGREFRKLRTRLDKGEPAVLALIRAGRDDDPRTNHQVVAHAYRFDDQSQQLVIEIYDPNHPGEEPTIAMGLQNPRGGLHARQSTGEPLRGIFVIDYERGKPPFH